LPAVSRTRTNSGAPGAPINSVNGAESALTTAVAVAESQILSNAAWVALPEAVSKCGSYMAVSLMNTYRITT
jgi:hypothetical protein